MPRTIMPPTELEFEPTELEVEFDNPASCHFLSSVKLLGE